MSPEALQVCGDADPKGEIARIEDEIERLAEIAERCRKFMFGAQVAIGLGGLTLAAILAGFARTDPTPLIAALAAIIGGIVVLGSNATTRRQTLDALAAEEARRTALIDGLDLHVV